MVKYMGMDGTHETYYSIIHCLDLDWFLPMCDSNTDSDIIHSKESLIVMKFIAIIDSMTCV